MKLTKISTTFAFAICFPVILSAQSNFTGGGDGVTWNDPANWDSGVPLGVNANVGDGFAVNLASDQFVNETDIVGDQSVGMATLNHTAGTLDNLGWMKVGHESGNDGTLMMSGDAVINYAALFVASNGGNAMIDLSDNAGLNGGGFSVGLNPSKDTDVMVNITDNATINATDFNLGTATLNQSGGEVTASSWIAISNNNGLGVYKISGGSVTLTSDWFTVGETTPGSLNISGDASVEAVQGLGMLVGRFDNATGTLEITGSNASINLADLRVGLDQDGMDSAATGTLSWIADADGVSPIVSNDNTEFGSMDSTLLVDLTAYTGSDREILLIDNAMPVSGNFNGLPENSSVSVGGGQTATISYIGGDGNDIVLTLDETKVLVGDVNCDGEINLLDVAPFVELLTSDGFSEKADINGDGSVNLLDVAPFVALLTGN